MEETENTSKILRNRFLEEVQRYNRVFGDLADFCDSMGKARGTMKRRVNNVVDQIKDVFNQYSGQQNHMEAFLKDYPYLEPIVSELSKLDTNKDGYFDFEDLRMLASRTSKVSTSTSKSPPQGSTGNPFKV